MLPTIRNVTRIESWSFFAPSGPATEPDYTLLGNRATVGIRVDSPKLTVSGSFQYAQLVGLPSRAFGPGPLGPGSLFYAAAENTRAYQLYFKSLSLRLKGIAPGLSVEVGRMPHESGEGTPFAGRLIGNAEWTVFERAFDGARVDVERPEWRAQASFLMPTQGAFEESASPTIANLQLASGRWTRRGLDVFVHNYRDTRAIHARPDNTGIEVTRADITIQTVGGSLSAAWGPIDLQVWSAVQRGDWYGDTHRAASGSVQAGYQWPRAFWQPRLHAGVLHASGDADPNDDRHGTFFPMVPTTSPAALSGTYAHMNLQDVYVRGEITPHARLTISSALHRLALADRQDRWYSGTGATAVSGSYFGFSSRPSALRTGLGTLFELSAVSQVTRAWRISATAAAVSAGPVVRRQFAGKTLTVFVLESTLSLP